MNKKTFLQYITTCLILTIGGYFLSHLIIIGMLSNEQRIGIEERFFEKEYSNNIIKDTTVIK